MTKDCITLNTRRVMTTPLDGARAAAQVAMTTQQATNGYFTIQALTSDGSFISRKLIFLGNLL